LKTYFEIQYRVETLERPFSKFQAYNRNPSLPGFIHKFRPACFLHSSSATFKQRKDCNHSIRMNVLY